MLIVKLGHSADNPTDVVAAGVRIHPKSGKPIVEASDDEDL